MDNVKFEDKVEIDNNSLFESIDEQNNNERKNKHHRKRKRNKNKPKSYSELIGEYDDADAENKKTDIQKKAKSENENFESIEDNSIKSELSDNRTTCPKDDNERKRLQVNVNAKQRKNSLLDTQLHIEIQQFADVSNFQDISNDETELNKQSYDKYVSEQVPISYKISQAETKTSISEFKNNSEKSEFETANNNKAFDSTDIRSGEYYVDENALKKQNDMFDNSGVKHFSNLADNERAKFQETEFEKNVSDNSAMFEKNINNGNVDPKGNSSRVIDKKRKLLHNNSLDKNLDSTTTSYFDNGVFNNINETGKSYSDFEKSVTDNGKLFENSSNNEEEYLFDNLNTENDIDSVDISKNAVLTTNHREAVRESKNKNFDVPLSDNEAVPLAESLDFEKSVAESSGVFENRESNDVIDFDVKWANVTDLDNIVSNNGVDSKKSKGSLCFAKNSNDEQTRSNEDYYGDNVDLNNLSILDEYSKNIDAKSNAFADKLAADEDGSLFADNENYKADIQEKIFNGDDPRNIYVKSDEKNISDILETDDYKKKFQSENSTVNEVSTSKTKKSTDNVKPNSFKKGKNVDYDNTFDNIAVYKKERPRLKNSVIRKANKVFNEVKRIEKVIDVDSNNTISEDTKNIALNTAVGVSEKALKDAVFNSIKIDKFGSDKKNNFSVGSKVSSYSDNSALKEISKKYTKSQQYKSVMEMQQLYKQAAIKAAKSKAMASTAKGLMAFFSIPVAPIITAIVILTLVAMFIWSATLIILGLTDGLVSTSYMTTNNEITSSTAYYTKLESEFLADVNKTIEKLNDDKDVDQVETEFDPIEHNPEQLEAYLSAVYPGYDFNGGVINWLLHEIIGYPYYGFNGIKNVEKDIFDYQYSTEVKYREETVGDTTITIATVYIKNKGFDSTIEYFLQNLPEKYYEKDETEIIYDHYKDLREYRGNHGFWLGTPVDYDWRNYAVGLYGYETEDGGITGVSSADVMQNKSAVTEVTDEDLSHYTQKALGSFTTTGYCPCVICCGKYSPEVTGKPSTTASGTFPIQGRTIAVDPKVIPLGAKVLINGHIYIAEDTGGAIKGNRIDVYYNNHQDALVHGKQYNVPVYLLTLKTNIEDTSVVETSVTNMTEEAVSSENKLVDIALAEYEDGIIGVPNKYTKWYGEVKGTTSYNWCAAFVSYCVDKADMNSIVPKTAAVSDLMENAKKSGIWQGKDNYKPVPGDIMIQKEGSNSHTGIVVESTDTYFVAVEGNSGSSSLNNSKVGKYKYFYDRDNAVTGFIKTGSSEENFGGSMYYKFDNFAKGTDIKKHNGIDIAGDENTDVLAVIDGTVKTKTSTSIVLENDMFEITYESLKDIDSSISRGSEITKGQVVAKMDDAENRKVSFVHISVIQKDGKEDMDPFIYCDVGSGEAPNVNLSSSLVSVGIGGGTVSALFGDIHAPYTDKFASRAVVTSSFFDTYHSSFHRAIDLDVTYGSNVGIAAVWDGKVVLVGSGNGNGLTGYGYVVVLEHSIDGVKVYTKYNHMKMNSSNLKVGDVVSAGQQIGIQGSTGFVNGEHLDFQMGICTSGYNWSEFSNHLINPIAIYQGWSQSLQTISVWNSSGGCVRKGDDYAQTRKVNNMSGKHIF